MSITARVVCNCNFKKPCDIDQIVFKVFKMFAPHLEKSSSPISEDSEIECVYQYKNLTPDHLRMLKKLADNNKTSIYLKEVVVVKGRDEGSVVESGPGLESGSGSESGSESNAEDDELSLTSSISTPSMTQPPEDTGIILETIASLEDRLRGILDDLQTLKPKT